MIPPSNVDELIARAREGSEKSFTEIVRLYQGRVRSYLYRLLFNKADDIVDDLAQECFLTAYRELPAFTGESPFDLWLLRVAKNRALTLLRDEERRRAREQSALGSVVAGLWASRLQGESDHERRHETRLEALRTCLDGLPGHSAQMVREFYFRGKPAEEIARASGRKEGAIWVALTRIRQALRECIDTKLKAGGAIS